MDWRASLMAALCYVKAWTTDSSLGAGELCWKGEAHWSVSFQSSDGLHSSLVEHVLHCVFIGLRQHGHTSALTCTYIYIRTCVCVHSSIDTRTHTHACVYMCVHRGSCVCLAMLREG